VETPHWSFYDTKEELDELMRSLNTNGIRERALNAELRRYYDNICLALPYAGAGDKQEKTARDAKAPKPADKAKEDDNEEDDKEKAEEEEEEKEKEEEGTEVATTKPSPLALVSLEKVRPPNPCVKSMCR
jgi:hypothetical protein